MPYSCDASDSSASSCWVVHRHKYGRAPVACAVAHCWPSLSTTGYSSRCISSQTGLQPAVQTSLARNTQFCLFAPNNLVLEKHVLRLLPAQSASFTMAQPTTHPWAVHRCRASRRSRTVVCRVRNGHSSQLNHGGEESERRGSNPRRLTWEVSTLPLSYVRRWMGWVLTTGSRNTADPGLLRRLAAVLPRGLPLGPAFDPGICPPDRGNPGPCRANPRGRHP